MRTGKETTNKFVKREETNDARHKTCKEGQKKPWQKPVVVLLNVGGTASGPTVHPVEDPNLNFYGPS